MKQIKVLHLVPGLASGGISAVLLNYYKNMDTDKVKFDFAVFMPELGITADAFRKMGSEIHILPRKSENIKAYKEKLMSIMKEGGYDVVHAHQNYQSFIPLYYAKKCGIPVRIAHAHSTEIDKSNVIKKTIKLIGNIANPYIVTDYFACGKEAGSAMFGRQMQGKRAQVLKNAVSNERYAYSPQRREEVRKNMNWDDKFIVGHIGRMSRQKNQLFLVDIFGEVLKHKENAVLCICGDGPDREKLVSYIKEKKLEDKVELLGNRGDVSELINGFDVFLLPSLFEGLPVTGIEALTNGVPSVMSDTITKEFDEYNKVRFLSLDDEISKWASAVIEAGESGHDAQMTAMMKKAGYDIVDSAKFLEQFYIDKVFNNE